MKDWMKKRRQRFSPARGLWFFLAGLVVFPVTVALSAAFGGAVSLTGALAYVVVMSVAAGVIGTFTENVPF